MPRHFDFGNNRHVPLFGEADELSDFLLRVKTAVKFARLLAERNFRRPPIPSLIGFIDAPGADLRQPRILLDFDTPAGTVRQVKMQTVQFVKRHRGDEFFDFAHRKEVPRNIQVKAAPTQGRSIFNTQRGKCLSVVATKLVQAHKRVKLPRFRRMRNDNILRRYFKTIALVSAALVFDET